VLQNRLNSIFQGFAKPDEASETLVAGNFVLAVDVYEDAEKLVLKLEVPGIRREDLDIRVVRTHADSKARAQVRERGEGRKFSSHRAPLWQLHAAFDGEHGEG
jgi:HSP20 family molecular chaperone IbpA